MAWLGGESDPQATEALVVPGRAAREFFNETHHSGNGGMAFVAYVPGVMAGKPQTRMPRLWDRRADARSQHVPLRLRVVVSCLIGSTVAALV